MGPQVIASVVKRFDRGVEYAVADYAQRRLTSGRDITLNIGNDAVSLVGISPQVAPSIRARLEHIISTMRARLRQAIGLACSAEGKDPIHLATARPNTASTESRTRVTAPFLRACASPALRAMGFRMRKSIKIAPASNSTSPRGSHPGGQGFESP
jgi:hypothetical protein